MKINELQLADRLDQARALTQEGKPLHAAQVYIRLISVEPGCVPAYVELSSLYADLGMISGAAGILSSLAAQYPDNNDITLLIGNLYMRAEEYGLALTYLKKLASLKIPEVHFNMGVAYFCKGNIKLAEEQFRLTLTYDPEFPKINESIGELLIKRNAYAEAMTYLKRGISTDPYSAINHHLLGIAYSKMYDWKKAYAEFVLAIEMDPNEPANWSLCGEMLMQLQRPDEAEQYLRKALELNPNSVDSLVALGQLCLGRGDTSAAQEHIGRALAIDPKSSRAREMSWKLRGPRRPHSIH